MAGDELELIRWLKQRSCPGSGVRLGIGDDMAAVATPASETLIASDLLLDGVHFDSTQDEASAIGRKAVARCLSDCAAMAARPRAIVASLALPSSMSTDRAKAVLEGIICAAGEFRVTLVGGDLARWNQSLAIDITVIAEPFDDLNCITRSGAEVNDRIFVTGRLGGSILNHHMTFRPRIEEARVLAERLGGSLHAMIDISDGLSLDLSRICEASSVGAVLDERLLLNVASDDARRASQSDGVSVTDHVLGDGEDYELLLVVSDSADVNGLTLWPLGYIIDSGLFLNQADGQRSPLAVRGYVH